MFLHGILGDSKKAYFAKLWRKHFYSSHNVHTESHDMVQSVWTEKETKIFLIVIGDFTKKKSGWY